MSACQQLFWAYLESSAKIESFLIGKLSKEYPAACIRVNLCILYDGMLLQSRRGYLFPLV